MFFVLILYFLVQIRSQFQILAREQRELAGRLAEDEDDVAVREEEFLLLQAGRAVAKDLNLIFVMLFLTTFEPLFTNFYLII